MSDRTKAVKGTKKLTTSNTMANAVRFMVDQAIGETVNTAEVVSVDVASQTGTDGPAGYAAATPLVCPIDGFNQSLPTTSIPKMPFFRPQAGKAAIVMDPQPGDKGIAVFMKRDSSGVATGKGDPVQPASFRTFDQADGYLINGFLGEAPEIWLHLNPVTGDISLSTKAANIDISCRESGDIDIKTGAGNITIQAGEGGEGTITLDGKVVVTRTMQVQNKNNESASQFTGGFENTGGSVTSNSITLETHTHTGVQPGGGDTGSPNEGT
jgi:phage baseplate assembly protein gpV